MQELDYLLIIVTKKAGIAKSIYTEYDLKLFHKDIFNRLKVENIFLDQSIYYCPHHVEEIILFIQNKCNCRKFPNLGF